LTESEVERVRRLFERQDWKNSQIRYSGRRKRTWNQHKDSVFISHARVDDYYTENDLPNPGWTLSETFKKLKVDFFFDKINLNRIFCPWRLSIVDYLL